MPTQLLAVVTTVTLDSGDSVVWQHGLRANDKPVTPTQVIAGGPSTIGVTAVDDTTVTLENLGPDTATGTFRAEYDHSIHAVDTPTVAWKGWDGTARPAGPAGGDLFGTYPNPQVYGIEGYPIEQPPPLNGEAILFNEALQMWEHAPIIFGGGPPVGPAGRDLGGIYPDPLVVGLQDSPLPSPAIADGFVKRNAANTGWEEVAYGSAANTVTQGNDPRLSDARIPTGTAGGDLDGTYPNPTVDGLQNRPVAATAPSTDDVLAWSGTAWTPVAIDTLVAGYTPVVGIFSDSTVQTVPTGPTALAIIYNTIELSNGVTVVGGSRLTVPVDGLYGFNISPEMVHVGGTGTIITFWGAVNGVAIPRSASSFEMGNNNGRVLPFIQLDLNMNAGQYFEWYFNQSGINTTLQPFIAAAPAPITPSVIVAVKRIGAKV